MSVQIRLLGNKKNISHLSEALSKGRLSHAYIINAPKGGGKKTLAEYLAYGLLCDSINAQSARTLEDGPCGTCLSCIRAFSGNHPDMIRVFKDKKDKSISVDLIRERIIDDINIKPYYGRYKIYIVEDAHLMSESAQNALLKTIEEPPSYAVILLLTENPKAFLPTILSRCICLDAERLPRQQIADVLKTDCNVSRADAEKYADYASGNLGIAIDLAGEGTKKALIEDILVSLKKMHAMDAGEIYEYAVRLADESISEVLDIYRKLFRDILMIRSGCQKDNGRQSLYFNAESILLTKAAKEMTYEQINGAFAAIDTAEHRAQANVKADAVLEALLLSLRGQMCFDL